MPRLSICRNPDDPNQDYENISADVCQGCWPPPAEELQDVLPPMSLDIIERALRVEDTEVGCEHPPYSDDVYVCCICGERLTDEDN